jgi:hypothetical protein
MADDFHRDIIEKYASEAYDKINISDSFAAELVSRGILSHYEMGQVMVRAYFSSFLWPPFINHCFLSLSE